MDKRAAVGYGTRRCTVTVMPTIKVHDRHLSTPWETSRAANFFKEPIWPFRLDISSP